MKTYSEWMSDEAIREATASERLTLAEEYDMQKSWREDPDKLTFILSLPSKRILEEGGKTVAVYEGSDDTSELLVGDVNLFLYEADGDDDEEDGKGSDVKEMAGEIELMIARKEFQGKGLGKIAVIMFILYVLENSERIVSGGGPGPKKLSYLRVKIGKDNARSLGLFERLGFKKTSEEPNYFGEWELRLEIENKEAVTNGMLGHLARCGVVWQKYVMFSQSSFITG